MKKLIRRVEYGERYIEVGQCLPDTCTVVGSIEFHFLEYEDHSETTIIVFDMDGKRLATLWNVPCVVFYLEPEKP